MTDAADGVLDAILIAAEKGADMASVSPAELDQSGLAGDRHAGGDAADAVTVIAREGLEAFCAERGIPCDPADFRRNLVVRDLDPETLVGRRFRIGDVLLEGTEIADPCAYLADRLRAQHGEDIGSGRALVAGLLGRSGIRARIIEPGRIAVGDPVVPA